MHYADRIQEKILESSPVCVGLDPVLEKLPDSIAKTLNGVDEFCHGIIDSICDIACAVKPQLAYFEMFGWQGMKLFFELCAYAQSKRLLVIADGKRGDIGSTCEAYARAYLSKDAPIDALTVHPYLGSDSIRPFADLAFSGGKGLYVLVKTSNPSSGELQDLPIGDESLHEHLAQLVESWSTAYLGSQHLSCVGAVCGATYPEEMKYLRTLMPHVPFLLPGYGAQGATAQDCAHGFLPDGTGAVVSASRSILYASSGEDWQSAAKQEAEKMAKELRRSIPSMRSGNDE